MKEMAERMLGMDCIVYTLNGQLEGVLEEATENALLLRRADGSLEAVNLDFVLRIREYPRKKNGKKRGLVVD